MMRSCFLFLLGGIVACAATPGPAQQLRQEMNDGTMTGIVGSAAISDSAAVLPDAPEPQDPAGTKKKDPATTEKKASKEVPSTKQQPKRILGIMPNYRAVSAGAIPVPR